MTPEEFNRLANELIRDLPITLITTRLLLALRHCVDAGGEGAAQALRDYCKQRQELEGESGWEHFRR